MFLKNSLNLIILSILSENPEGLTGYALIKEIKRYIPIKPPSPGTIYPKLNKLEESGEIEEKDKNYFITEKGKQTLKENIPDFLDRGEKTLPTLFNFLIQSLPIDIRVKYISYPTFGAYSYTKIHKKKQSTKKFIDQLQFDPSLSSTVKTLDEIKENLKIARKEIQEKYENDMKNIEKKLELIEQKIAECKKEKKSWKKISIEELD